MFYHGGEPEDDWRLAIGDRLHTPSPRPPAILYHNGNFNPLVQCRHEHAQGSPKGREAAEA
ncbi:hypothetical protein IAQ61_000338 [Plenodomus lingam]|uniref:uncharacterized protein n=1 Tax=Leptosphaeria maculans TaxID=5022 RepID=UPI0033234424|nr:hypothetical protein IAQ61_000338 [Plenodomus lingam]